MKRISIAACLLSLLVSCTSSPDQQGLSTSFLLQSTNQGFVKDNFGELVYHYKCSLKNNTSNVYKEVKITMRVILNLDNGNQLTDESINEDGSLNFFAALGSMHLSNMIQPGETQEMREFESAAIDPKYASYPIQSVHLQFTAEAKDEVNDTSSGAVLIKDEDITPQWQTAVAQIQPQPKP